MFDSLLISLSSVSWRATGAHRLWMAAAVTVAFAALARLLRGVSNGGALAGAAVCFLIYLGSGPAGLLALVSVFFLTWITTRFGYRRKQKLGIAEKPGGRRAPQVLANLTIAALCALLHRLSPGHTIYLLGIAAALSEAAADTVSSEIGKASTDQARLITNWKVVPAGADGGVSPFGTLAGLLAAGLVGSVCAIGGLIPWRWLGVSVTAAVGGMIADSYMGASLERRRLLNNDLVNFLSTCVAVGIAWLLV